MKFKKLGPYIEQIRGLSFKPEDIISEQLEGYIPIIRSTNITEEGFAQEGLIYLKSVSIKPEQLIKPQRCIKM